MCDHKACLMAVARVEGKYGKPNHRPPRSDNCTSGSLLSSAAGHIQSRVDSGSAPLRPSLRSRCPLYGQLGQFFFSVEILLVKVL